MLLETSELALNETTEEVGNTLGLHMEGEDADYDNSTPFVRKNQIYENDVIPSRLDADVSYDLKDEYHDEDYDEDPEIDYIEEDLTDDLDSQLLDPDIDLGIEMDVELDNDMFGDDDEE